MAKFHQYTALSCQVSCRYLRTHAVWEVIVCRRNLTPTPSSLAYCNRYQLSQTPAFFLCQPPRCLSDRFFHPPLYHFHYITSLSSSCVTSLCASFPVFHSAFPSFLIFLPASTFSPVMHCCRGHLLCPSLFMIPAFSTLAQKDTWMKYSPAQLAVKWFTRLVYPAYVTCTHCSHVCTVLI